MTNEPAQEAHTMDAIADAPSSSRITAPDIRVLFAGNATFTIHSTNTGKRYTYKIKKREASAKYPAPAWFVSLLRGPDNSDDFSYIGMTNPDTLNFWTTRASTYPAQSRPCLVFKWLLEKLSTGTLPPHVEILHSGRCMRCGRKLTVPESIHTGLGPECAGKL